MRVLRILIFVFIAVAAWLAVSGLRRRDHRRLLGSLVVLLCLAGLFPLTLWLERSPPTGAPDVVDPAAWRADARAVIIRVRPTAFDKVGDCLRHVERLVEFYRRYPGMYDEPLAEGESLLRSFTGGEYGDPSLKRRRHCVDEKALHRYVTEGHRDLLASAEPGR